VSNRLRCVPRLVDLAHPRMAARTSTTRDLLPRRRHLARGAFTLAEGLIASVVLAIAVAGIATMVSAAAAQASAVRQDAVALGLARELLELTAGVPFAIGPKPGFIGGNTDFTTYDDIRDFDGYTDSITAADTGLVFARSITVGTDAGPLTNPTDVRVVTITISSPRGRQIKLSRFVTIADSTREGT
jgi:hypothetical protein